MPQEYSTRTPGSPAPSPTSFGSEPMKLDQPNFVAQTNVAQAPDVFGTLQEILGLGAKVGIQFQDAKTQAIKDNISLENAKQAKLDRIEAIAARQDVKLRREEAEKLRLEKKVADQLLADYNTSIANAKTPEEEAQLKADFLKRTNEAQAAGKLQEQEAGLVAFSRAGSAEDALKRDEDVLKNAVAQSISLESGVITEQLVKQADEAGLQAQYNTLIDRLDNPTLTEPERGAILGAARHTNSSLHALKSDTRVEAQEEEKIKNALYSAAHKAVTKEANGVAVGLSINVLAVEAQLDAFAVSDESIRKAVFDMGRELMFKANPALGELWSSKNPIEAKAASEALESALNPFVSQIADVRRQKKSREYARQWIDSAGFTASNGDLASVHFIVDELNASPLNESQRRAALAEIGIEFVNGAASRAIDAPDAVALQSYQTLIADPRMDDLIKLHATRTMQQRIVDTGKRILADRYASAISYTDGVPNTIQNPPNVNAGGVAVPDEARLFGYANQHVTELDAINSQLGKHYGLTVDQVQQSALLMELLGPQINTIATNYRADDSAKLKAESADATNLARADKDSRAKLDVNAAFDSSTMGQLINKGMHKSVEAADMRGLLQEALQGYRSSDIPAALKKILTDGVADPDNRILIREFWQVMKPGENPKIDAMMIKDKDLQVSYAMGMFMQTLRNAGEFNSKTETDLTAEFYRNILAASEGPALSSADRKNEAMQQAARLDEAMTTLTGGVGIDMGVFDAFGVDPKAAFASMGESDQAQMYQIAVMAAAAPQGLQQTMLSTFMKEHGFAVYQPIEGQFNLVNNARGYSKPNPVPGGDPIPGSRGLPSPEEVNTLEFKLYLQSHVGKAAEFIKTLPSLAIAGATATFSEADVGAIRIAPFDRDLREGRSAIAVNYKGKEFYVPIHEISISDQDFYAWRASEAGKAKVKKAQEDAMPSPKLGM